MDFFRDDRVPYNDASCELTNNSRSCLHCEIRPLELVALPFPDAHATSPDVAIEDVTLYIYQARCTLHTVESADGGDRTSGSRNR